MIWWLVRSLVAMIPLETMVSICGSRYSRALCVKDVELESLALTCTSGKDSDLMVNNLVP